MQSVSPAPEPRGDQINRLYYGEIFTERAQRWSRERIGWFLENARGSTVLDVGCSQGIVSILLAREGFDCLGIDISPDQIAYARAELAREDVETQRRVRLEVSDLRDLTEGTYDTVVLGEVLEHDPEPESLLRSASMRLAPGGLLLVTVPYGYQPAEGHLRSFYFSNLHDLVSTHFEVEEIRLLNRNLVCRAGPGPKGEAFEFDRECVGMIETLYEELGQEFYELKEALALRNEHFAKAKEQLADLRGKLTARSDQIAKLKDRIDAGSKLVAELRAKLEARAEDVASLKGKLAERTERLAQARGEAQSSSRMVEGLKQDLDEASQRMAQLQQELETARQGVLARTWRRLLERLRPSWKS